MTRILLVSVLGLGLLADPSSAWAGSAECAGISDVFPTNPDLAGDLTAVRVAAGLLNPLQVTQPPGDLERLFIVEQQGKIRIVVDGVMLPTPFLDLDDGPVIPAPDDEQGLMSLAFHPDYETNGHFFVFYTDPSWDNVVARYQVSAGDPNVANEASGQIVITFDHPSFGNHNGGRVAFGPDGHLYVATGDGGSSCDPGPGGGYAQDLSSHHGKLHRLNVDQLPFTTDGNPFVGRGLPSIWAYGLRNPYTFSFDRVTGNVLIADVGQLQWEEVDCGASPLAGGGGENYGWVPYEGTHCPNPSCGPKGSCALAEHVAPIHEYDHSAGCAIIGGSVYRGCRMSALRGSYFFGDYCSAFIHSIRLPAAPSCPGSVITSFIDRTGDLAPGSGLSIAQITSIGEDNQGELYVTDRGQEVFQGGEVFKIIPNLNIMEVSGPNATPFLMGENWTFENLASHVEHAIVSYTIYRSVADPTGPFTCLQSLASASACSSATCTWAGGDPGLPAANQVFYYLVTATNAVGRESTAGAGSDGTLRYVECG